MNLKDKAIEKVKYDGLKLETLADKWKRDIDVVMTACKNNGYAIKYASEDLKSNRELARIVLSSQGLQLSEFSESIKNDKELVEIAVKINGYAFRSASNELKNDREYVLYLAENTPIVFGLSSDEIKSDFELIQKFLPRNQTLYYELPIDLRSNKELAIKTIEMNGLGVFICLSDDLKKDKEFILSCIDLVQETQFKRSSESVMKMMPDRFFGLLPYIDPSLQNDIEFVKEVLKKDKRLIHRADDLIKNNLEIVALLNDNS